MRAGQVGKVIAATILLVVPAVPSFGQETPAKMVDNDFEKPLVDGMPAGWVGVPEDTVQLDEGTSFSGDQSIRLARDETNQESTYTAFRAFVPMVAAGGVIRLSGALRTRDVTGYATVMLRFDGPQGPIAFTDLLKDRVSGTTDWNHYSVELAIPPGVRTIVYGAVLVGEGTAWIDDFEVTANGEPLATAPPLIPSKTVHDLDVEFDEGSRIERISDIGGKTEDLALLAKIWGFVKYHDRRVATGQHHWDYELFRIMPRILGAQSPSDRNFAILEWLRGLGQELECESCAHLPDDVLSEPDIGWVADQTLLGEDLSRYLLGIYENRPTDREQFYVSVTPNAARNPRFTNELPHEFEHVPDLGYRLLALFRLWNIVEYWYPYRDFVESRWDTDLRALIPVFAAATSPLEYERALHRTIAIIRDSHSYLSGGTESLPPTGPCGLPIGLKLVSGEVVVRETGGSPPNDARLRVGDTLLKLDEQPVESLMQSVSVYYPGSTEAARSRNILTYLTRGACGPVEVEIERSGNTVSLSEERRKMRFRGIGQRVLHRSEKKPVEELANGIYRIDGASFDQEAMTTYEGELFGAKAWIVDLRGYPLDSALMQLARHLVSERTKLARVSAVDLANPGAIVWWTYTYLEPRSPSFDGKVAVIVDEWTQSHAEYVAMAFQASSDTLIVGSTTSGANGNVSRIALPGGYSTAFSGLGIHYPDGSKTQRVGIVPGVRLEPTVEAIRDGRDDVLDRTLEEIAKTTESGLQPIGGAATDR